MPVDLANATARQRTGRKSIGRTILLLVGYLLGTAFLIMTLEPGMTPPGFTGSGAWAMGLLFVGAFHVAGRIRAPWVFFLFGAAGAFLLLPAYFSDSRLGLRIGAGYTTLTTFLLGWSVFILTVAFLTRLAAKIRWRLILEVPEEGPRCGQCGYDLRASSERCPECGTPFDINAGETYRVAKRWDWKWLIHRTLVASAVILIPLAIADYWLYWRSEQPMIEEVYRLGGNVDSESDLPREWTPWSIWGAPVRDSFQHTVQADFSDRAFNDSQIKVLAGFNYLNEIHLARTRITGTGFACLTGSLHLERLYVPGTEINDAGMVQICRLGHLRELELSGTRITDASLTSLRGLSQLSALWLERTAITDNGLKALADIPHLEYLFLGETAITDGGLGSLTGLSSLQTLGLTRTAITDAGLMKLTALPNLNYLDVSKTRVTPEGVAAFKALRSRVDVDLAGLR